MSAATTAHARRMAHMRWAYAPSEEERRENMAPAWAGRDRRFYVQAHEMHPTASEADIERCVGNLKKAWYSELAMRRWEKHPPKKGGKAA